MDGDETEAFNSDDDELTLPKESPVERLSWRNDDSFSDWAIIISFDESISHTEGDDGGDVNRKKSERQKFTYNVHKNILATGPRRKTMEDNTSRSELHELVAIAYPEFLDYMYNLEEMS